MDADRFDDLTRTLIGRRSRRRLVATAGALLGGLLARAPFDGADDALADKKKGNGKKKKKKPAPCRAGDCCTNNKPGCPAGLKCCGESCIDKSWCCEDGAAKVPDCGQTCCEADEECCAGKCYDILLQPLCDPCRPKTCVSGQGFKCIPVMEGTPCGDKCCPEGQQCCGETNCFDPETQCCGFSSLVGVPCDGGACCVSDEPYKQSCCIVDFPNPGSKVCYGRLSPCAACENRCGSTCCDLRLKCCFADGSKPDRCIDRDESCSA